jgi:hypothetical protein
MQHDEYPYYERMLMMETKSLTNDELLAHHRKLTAAGWSRAVEIAKRRKQRHEKIDFDNPLFMGHLLDLEQELKNRGLK